MDNNKKIYFSDKPIDMSKIETITDESLEMPIDWEEATKPHTISFDCEVPKETADFFKKQMEELQEKESEILDAYRNFAKFNASYYLPVFDALVEEEQKFKLLEDIILKAMCKGWNDCFDINVKQEKKKFELFC